VTDGNKAHHGRRVQDYFADPVYGQRVSDSEYEKTSEHRSQRPTEHYRVAVRIAPIVA